MRPVAERAVCAVLAAAEINWAISLGGVRSRSESGSFMGSVAEWLRGALAAGAPVIGLAYFDGDGDRGFLRDDGFGYGMERFLDKDI